MSKSVKERREFVEMGHHLSIVRQCELLEIHRSELYYSPRGETGFNLELMRLIDEEHMLHQWLGVPRMTEWLREDKGFKVNKKRIERLFGLLGISAVGPKPNTSKRGKGALHKVFKYLLRDLKVGGPNHVWAMDIAYIPVRGVTCPCAPSSTYIVDMLSDTMTFEWCRRTLETAVMNHGAPEILNTDQGSQCTAKEFHTWVTDPQQGIKLSIDGKGRAIDNIFIERLWRSIKYEHVYLFPADNGLECYRASGNTLTITTMNAVIRELMDKGRSRLMNNNKKAA